MERSTREALLRDWLGRFSRAAAGSDYLKMLAAAREQDTATHPRARPLS